MSLDISGIKNIRALFLVCIIFALFGGTCDYLPEQFSGTAVSEPTTTAEPLPTAKPRVPEITPRLILDTNLEGAIRSRLNIPDGVETAPSHMESLRH